MRISCANRLTNDSLQSLALLLVATLFPVHLLALDRSVAHLRSRKREASGVGVHDTTRELMAMQEAPPFSIYHTMWGRWEYPCSPACTHRTASCRPFRNLGVHSTQTVCRCVLHRPHHLHDHRSSPLLVPLFLVQECEYQDLGFRNQLARYANHHHEIFSRIRLPKNTLTSTTRRVEEAREGRASRAMGLRRPSVVADRDTEPASGLTAAMLALKLVLWKNWKVTFLLSRAFLSMRTGLKSCWPGLTQTRHCCVGAPRRVALNIALRQVSRHTLLCSRALVHSWYSV